MTTTATATSNDNDNNNNNANASGSIIINSSTRSSRSSSDAALPVTASATVSSAVSDDFGALLQAVKAAQSESLCHSENIDNQSTNALNTTTTTTTTTITGTSTSSDGGSNSINHTVSSRSSSSSIHSSSADHHRPKIPLGSYRQVRERPGVAVPDFHADVRSIRDAEGRWSQATGTLQREIADSVSLIASTTLAQAEESMEDPFYHSVMYRRKLEELSARLASATHTAQSVAEIAHAADAHQEELQVRESITRAQRAAVRAVQQSKSALEERRVEWAREDAEAVRLRERVEEVG